MTLNIRAVLLAAALVMPQACPVMAMGPSSMDMGMDMPSMQDAHVGWAMSAAPSMEHVASPVPPCCPMAKELNVTSRSSTTPQTGAYDFFAPPVESGRSTGCDDVETTAQQDSAGPPLTFEQRSVMKRE
jgi:hypothetical protein